MTAWPTPGSTLQMTPPIGRHCQNINRRAELENSTYVLRSTGSGTILVHPRLNQGRAIMLCCSAKRASSDAFTSKAVNGEPSGPESMDFGTPKFPRKPTAYN